MSDLNTIGGIHYDMMKRCYNETSVAYRDYGAKGITVYEEWHDREKFKQWAKENGYIKGLRLKRKDSSGNYEPSNCYFSETLMKKDGKTQYYKRVRKHRNEMKKLSGVPDKYCHLRIYRIYVGMHTRCENINRSCYKDYGGRGISVCTQWSGCNGFFNFYKWSMENGYKDSLSIDRIDNNKGYSPTNCRWADIETQINNRRISKKYKYNGKIMSIKEIAEINNVSYGKLYNRVVGKGMNIIDALDDIKIIN